MTKLDGQAELIVAQFASVSDVSVKVNVRQRNYRPCGVEEPHNGGAFGGSPLDETGLP